MRSNALPALSKSQRSKCTSRASGCGSAFTRLSGCQDLVGDLLGLIRFMCSKFTAPSAANPFPFPIHAAAPPSGFKQECFVAVFSLAQENGRHAIGSKCHHIRFRHCFRNWAGARRRVRFHSALAKYWTLSRRTDARDLWRAIAAEYFLHGAGERRRF